MRKHFKKSVIMTIIACALVAAVALVGCGGAQGGSGTNKHVPDPKPLGGENILDDGGAIKDTGSVFSLTCAEYAEEAEHKISFQTDTDKYELYGSQKLSTWNNSDSQFGRIQVTNAANGAIFKFDFTGVEDTSNVGCALNLIACRGSVLFSVSADKEHWIDIGFNQPDGIRCDAMVNSLEELSGKKVKDNNLKRAYFLLGEFVDESKVLYFRASFSKNYFQGTDAANNGIGADLIDYIAYYDNIKLVGEVV